MIFFNITFLQKHGIFLKNSDKGSLQIITDILQLLAVYIRHCFLNVIITAKGSTHNNQCVQLSNEYSFFAVLVPVK